MAIEKRFSVALDVKRPGGNRDIEVVEGDNGNIIGVTLTDGGQPVDLTGCRVLAVFSKSNGTSVQDSAAEGGGITIDENLVSIVLFIASFAPGMVECELQVYSGANLETLVTTAKFNFKCRRGIFNEDTAQATNEYPMLVELIEQCEELEAGLEEIDANEDARQTAETGRQGAEAARVTAETGRASAEGGRASAESGRVTAESGRTTAEGLRVTAESGRATAEGLRADAEAVRAAAEDDREVAEGARGGAEEDRESAEGLRVTAEGGRASAESARASAELSRASAESSRASAEGSRVTAEGLRVTAETGRAGAETARGAAETARGSAETSRASAESSRASVESLRVIAESARDAAEAARIAAESAREAAEAARAALMAARMVIGAYNAGTAYVPGNEATYNGSTYRNTVACTGVLPTVADNWILISQKGTDGEGAGDMLAATYDTDADGKVNAADDADTVNGHTVETDVPAGALFTDTVYTHPANHAPSIITQDASNRFVTDSEKTTWNGKQSTTGDAKDNTVTFAEAATRATLNSGESIATLIGKLKKWYTDFKALAWLDAVGTSQITDANVTSAKLANMAAYTLKGRNSGTTGVPGDVTMLDVAEYSLAQGTTATSVADAEYIPISVSSTSLKKITWANVIAAIKTALFSTTSGIAKLNGSGGVSAAVAGTDFQAPTTITINANTSPALGTIANNNEYRCTNASLSAAPTMTIAAIASTATEFSASIIFKAPNTTAPVVTNNSGYTLKYSGTDVSSGTFSPKASTVYRISFLFDGIYLNAYVMGVA